MHEANIKHGEKPSIVLQPVVSSDEAHKTRKMYLGLQDNNTREVEIKLDLKEDATKQLVFIGVTDNEDNTNWEDDFFAHHRMRATPTADATIMAWAKRNAKKAFGAKRGLKMHQHLPAVHEEDNAVFHLLPCKNDADKQQNQCTNE